MRARNHRTRLGRWGSIEQLTQHCPNERGSNWLHVSTFRVHATFYHGLPFGTFTTLEEYRLLLGFSVVGGRGIEPLTPSMSRKCSPAELTALLRGFGLRSAVGTVKAALSRHTAAPGAQDGFPKDLGGALQRAVTLG